MNFSTNKFKIAMFLSIGLMLFSIFNYILIITGSTLCKSDGCSLAGTMITIDKQYLYLLGSLFGSLMTYLAYFLKDNDNVATEQNEGKLNDLWNILITGAIIFESVIYLNLFITTGSVCLICSVFYILLISIFIATRPIITLFPIIISVFLALNLMHTSKVNFKVNSQYTLFQSESCPHCKKAKKALDEDGVIYTKVNALDSEAYSFLQSLNITSIPVLLEKTSTGYKIIQGDTNIINSLNKKQDIRILPEFKRKPLQELKIKSLYEYKKYIHENNIKKHVTKFEEKLILNENKEDSSIPSNTNDLFPQESVSGCKIKAETPCFDSTK